MRHQPHAQLDDACANLAQDNLSSYRFVPAGADLMSAYLGLVREVYEPLGFLNEHADEFLPRDGSRCYLLYCESELVGSCCLTPVTNVQSIFHDVVPAAKRDEEMIELNNVIVVEHLRGGVGLSLILYHAARTAMASGVGVVVGITRYQTLRHFVDAGAIPAFHEPLHLLGRDDLNDFVVYYDGSSPAARDYLEERARRIVQQAAVMRRIRERLSVRARPVHPTELAA